MTSPTSSSKLHAVIVGAGPAGLTAAAELTRIGHRVTVLEKDPEYVGGISRTVRHGKYRFDIGGHRFFSKNAEITEWWHRRLPDDFIRVRRMSRIYYRRRFFDYPLRPINAFVNLGPITSASCLGSYLWARMFPSREESTLDCWVSNRFGRRLFEIFFRTYTEKVWGMPCNRISADWAAQRIKGLSLGKAIANALFGGGGRGAKVVKTLIDSFEYPRLGPGMMWEKTRDDLQVAGARVAMGQSVIHIHHDDGRVRSVTTRDASGNEKRWEADAFIISMPLRDTVLALDPPPSGEALSAANELTYRDFVTVALMLEGENLFPDNWIYVHDPGVKLGRIQNFNNWSPEMVPEPGVTCLGLEYFCFEGDDLWTADDRELIALGERELHQLGLIQNHRVLDGAVVRMPKAYPVYDPGYEARIGCIRDALSPLANLQVIGRNGMHKYNNQDHSMMTGLLAARNIAGAEFDVWRVNTDAEYLEEKRG